MFTLGETTLISNMKALRSKLVHDKLKEKNPKTQSYPDTNLVLYLVCAWCVDTFVLHLFFVKFFTKKLT